MKRMKQLYGLVLIAGLLLPSGIMAQKVYKDGNKIILDLSVAAGMPKGAVTDESKTDVYKTYTASNTAFLNGVDNTGSKNEKVYQKLEIAPNDMDASGGMAGAGAVMYWDAAFNGCKSSTHDGDNWRLPTQRELMMMYIFKDAISGLETATNYYWSATENSAPIAWHVGFSNGTTSTTNKARNLQVRCVREIP